MSQASISSFFKRKADGSSSSETVVTKRPRIKTPERAKTPPRVSLSDRTKHWHLDNRQALPPSTPTKQAKHAEFVEKLGEYTQKQSQWRNNKDAGDAEAEPADEDSGEDEPAEHELGDKGSKLAARFALDASAVKATKATKSKSNGPKLTPLEEQVQRIQDENPATMLLVEVGYKYRFFGPDARTASQILGIAYFKSHSYLTASIPVHRLQFHVNRLVAAGKKVGVVRQIETAALKAVGDNRNKTFERKLCEVYSKGTYLGDNADNVVGGWILALSEGAEADVGAMPVEVSSQGTQAGDLQDASSQSAKPAKRKTPIAVVAIRAESGEVVHDVFDDGPLRADLEKRLLLLDVVEVIQVGPITSATKKIVYAQNRRIEQVTRLPTTQAAEKVREFYVSRYSEKDAAAVLAKILKLPSQVLVCLIAQIRYLEEFSLESIFTLTNFFSTFEEKACMQLPATALAALEVFHNSTDGSEHGSLFWLLNNTRTLPGRRLLRTWIARPLISAKDIETRQEAVREIVDARGSSFAQLDKMTTTLKRLPDLDRGLSKIFYRKSSRPEVLQTLQAFSRVSRTFDPREAFAFSSSVLTEGFASLCSIRDIIDGFLAEFNHVEAAKNDKYNMFKESDTLDSISDHKMGILIIESDLQNHLLEIGRQLKRKVIEYVTVAGIEFLIELKNDATKLVPKTWIKVSGTKYVSRFHTPTIIKLIAEREQRKELLAIECDAAYLDFLTRISAHYETLRWIVSTVAQIDCFLSLASVSRNEQYCLPNFSTKGPTSIELTDFRHPIIESILTTPYIPNTTHLAKDALRALIVSGPNMGGKSSFIKAIALITIMAQIGCYVPASSATLSILDGVYVRMGASDNALARESTFMVELHETSDILAHATDHSLVILDELGRGTSTFDGLAIASSVLQHVLTQIQCLLVFVTHYPSLKEYAIPPHCQAMHMSYLEGESGIVFLYKLADGMAERSYGLNVARLAGLGKDIIERADVKAQEFEDDMASRKKCTIVARFADLLEDDESEDGKVQALIDAIQE